MSRIEKLLEKFKTKPDSLSCTEIKNVLLHLGCDEIQVKGSHVKFKHPKLRFDLVIPIHRGDCKPFYKKQAMKQVSKLLP